MSPPKESNPLSKLVKRVCTTPLREEIDTRVRAGARQSDPRYSLTLSLAPSPSLESVIQSLPSPSQQRT